MPPCGRKEKQVFTLTKVAVAGYNNSIRFRGGERMDKQRAIAAAAETEEDRLLLARLYDRLSRAEERNIFAATGFLSPREQAMTQRMLPHLPLVFFGGCEGAERRVACYLPDYLTEDELTVPEGPVAAVRAVYYEKDALTHRDFLGSLMGAGIKRETVGDIYVSAGQCDFLVTRPVLPYLLENFTSAGRTRLRLAEIPLAEVQRPAAEKREIRDTVPSLRLDCLVGAAFSMARGPAGQLIAAGKVAVNDLVCLKGDRQLKEGDRIAVRGFGKAELAQVGGATRKGRLSVTLARWI